MAGARRDPTRWSRAADDLKAPLQALGTATASQVYLTGASGMWSDFNDGQPRRDDEVRAVLLAGDARDPGARVRLARRRRAAADADDPRPGRLRRARCTSLTHGFDDLDLGDELRADVRARARASTTRSSSSTASAARSSARKLDAARRGRGDDGHRRQGRAVLRRDGADLALRRDARARAPRSARWRSGSCSRSSSSSPRR